MRARDAAHPERQDPPGQRTGEPDLRDELQQERDRHLRTRADFENYRRRAEHDRESAGRKAKRDLLLALVGLADGFDRALAHLAESPGAVVEGVHGMRRNLKALLDAEGVTPYESVGQAFDPALHDAVAVVARAGAPPGTVVDETARGYRWNGELLRAAQVRVAE